jgi:hypothetical protein
VNQTRINQIAAGSPATPEEARELASMCQWRPVETAPMAEKVQLLYEGFFDCDKFAWIEGWQMPASPIGWLPLLAAPEVPRA